MTQAAWKLGQIAAITWLSYVMLGIGDPNRPAEVQQPIAYVVMPVFATILVAFGTAVLTRIADRLGRIRSVLRGRFSGLPYRAGRRFARLRAVRRQPHHAIEQGDGGSAGLRLG
ncbi:hypothetical protein PQI07_06565 [Methylobacterium sp. 092160098-2]|uniref:hypothetical protein n=1 Tax=Methylobacterium sp. 092160098-2 TaxID=3025129 RepID=UPI002381AEDF|nr:hypothetical protein [Methylobacterium sp. 092160098-2]MDE4910364.1 hypothetical protein [Methylobacterium sp. 092160098-2]